MVASRCTDLVGKIVWREAVALPMPPAVTTRGDEVKIDPDQGGLSTWNDLVNFAQVHRKAGTDGMIARHGSACRSASVDEAWSYESPLYSDAVVSPKPPPATLSPLPSAASASAPSTHAAGATPAKAAGLAASTYAAPSRLLRQGRHMM